MTQNPLVINYHRLILMISFTSKPQFSSSLTVYKSVILLLCNIPVIVGQKNSQDQIDSSEFILTTVSCEKDNTLHPILCTVSDRSPV